MLCKGKQDTVYIQQLKHIRKFLLSQYLIVPQKILKKIKIYIWKQFRNHSLLDKLSSLLYIIIMLLYIKRNYNAGCPCKTI